MASETDSLQATVEAIAERVLRVLAERQRPRGATYRFQFNANFKFIDATRLVPYLRSLGITHVYASPYLRAQTGSAHGYDVCQHDQLNPEVGTPEEYLAFVAALREHGLGQILDVVPNHMAASSQNPWWMDVLENGPSSPFAHYFDIDWRPVKDELADKVLLPILGEQYGSVLESGQLRLAHADGTFSLNYYDHVLPIGPKSSIQILNHRIEELGGLLGEASEAFLEYQSIITALEHLPPASATSPEQMAVRQREKEVVKRRMRRLEADEPRVSQHIARLVEEFNGEPGTPSSFDALDQLLAAQVYRLSHWRAASDEVNYRRFFDVNELAAVSMEAADVFEHAHRLIMQLAAHGFVDGLRIDHIDGLLDPNQYLWRLQWSYLAELGSLAYLQQRGESAGEAKLEVPPVLAIARREAALPMATHPESEARPAPEVAGAISGAVMGQDAVAGSVAVASFNGGNGASKFPSWTSLRRPLMQLLCERLELPSPDEELMSLAERPPDAGSTEAAGPSGAVFPQFAAGKNLPLYVAVEKILGPEEPLPPEWPVAGTSGYDFLQLLNGLLIPPDGWRDMLRFYERFIGERLEFSEVVYRCKLLILRFSVSSELQMLAHRLNRVSEHHRQSRDFTLNMLRHTLREIVASFPVYRTYAGPAGVSDRDRSFVNLAIARAKRRTPAIDAAIFDFIRSVLLLDHPDGLSDDWRRAREIFAGRFQQVTSPVMAKGVEDTAFYTYAPLASVNEVGSHPDVALVSIEGFHRDNVERLAKSPLAMIATSTHDTKRSEDVRARINVLAEIAPTWRTACNRWARMNRRFVHEVDGLPAPSRNDEYLLYQTLVGFWPAESVSEQEHATLVARLQAYMEKATHEAKTRTSWINPNQAYDEAMRQFVGKILERRRDNRFLPDFEKFLHTIVDAGFYTALSQTVLKLMSPGVPDIYQGQELWDFSLVDPDNRRPVDYSKRSWLLGELRAALHRGAESQRQLVRELAVNPRDFRTKLYVTWRLLMLRSSEPELFSTGRYLPLAVEGAKSEHLCAFAWQPRGGEPEKQVVVVAPRWMAQLSEMSDGETRWFANPNTWGDTRVLLPDAIPANWTNHFTGAFVPAAASLSMSELFADFPAAVLTAGTDP
jgi:malto-oligosyltrehalose synthase